MSDAKMRLLFRSMKRAQLNPTPENLLDLVRVSRRVQAPCEGLPWQEVQEVVEYVTQAPVLDAKGFSLPPPQGVAWPPPENASIQMWEDAITAQGNKFIRVTFVSLARRGQLGSESWLKVDDYVDAWIYNLSLQREFPLLSDFLGLTLDEYQDWTSGCKSLRKILFPKQKKVSNEQS